MQLPPDALVLRDALASLCASTGLLESVCREVVALAADYGHPAEQRTHRWPALLSRLDQALDLFTKAHRDARAARNGLSEGTRKHLEDLIGQPGWTLRLTRDGIHGLDSSLLWGIDEMFGDENQHARQAIVLAGLLNQAPGCGLPAEQWAKAKADMLEAINDLRALDGVAVPSDDSNAATKPKKLAKRQREQIKRRREQEEVWANEDAFVAAVKKYEEAGVADPRGKAAEDHNIRCDQIEKTIDRVRKRRKRADK